jgi:hypothetical protein
MSTLPLTHLPIEVPNQLASPRSRRRRCHLKKVQRRPAQQRMISTELLDRLLSSPLEPNPTAVASIRQGISSYGSSLLRFSPASCGGGGQGHRLFLRSPLLLRARLLHRLLVDALTCGRTSQCPPPSDLFPTTGMEARPLLVEATTETSWSARQEHRRLRVEENRESSGGGGWRRSCGGRHHRG